LLQISIPVSLIEVGSFSHTQAQTVLGRQKRLVTLESSRYNVKAEWVTI